MRLIKATKKELELCFEGNEANHTSVVFDISPFVPDLVPDKVTPRRVVISKPRSNKILIMAWSDFLKQETISNVVIIPIQRFKIGLKNRQKTLPKVPK